MVERRLNGLVSWENPDEYFIDTSPVFNEMKVRSHKIYIMIREYIGSIQLYFIYMTGIAYNTQLMFYEKAVLGHFSRRALHKYNIDNFLFLLWSKLLPNSLYNSALMNLLKTTS